MTDENKVEEQQVTPEEKARLEQVATAGRVADPQAAQKAAEAKAQQAADEKEAEEQRKQEEATRAATAKKDEEDEAAKDEAAKKEPWSPDWEKEWITVGNEHADAAIDLMKKTGMTPVEGNAVFAEAIESGDLTKVKWDVLEARLGKSTAALVKTGIQNYYDAEYKVQQELVSYAHEQVGGEKGWKDVQKWAQATETADPAFQKELNEWRKAISVGGFAARAAVDALKARFDADPKNRSTNRQLERGSTPPAGERLEGAPLSRKDYFVAYDKAGGDRAPKAVIDALNARREAGRKAGL